MRLLALLAVGFAVAGCGNKQPRDPSKDAYCKKYGYLYQGIPDKLNYCAKNQ